MTVGLGVSLIAILFAVFWIVALLILGKLSFSWGKKSRGSKLRPILATIFFTAAAIWIYWSAGPGTWIAKSKCTDEPETSDGVILPLKSAGVLLSKQPNYRTHFDILQESDYEVLRHLVSRGFAFVETHHGVMKEVEIAYGLKGESEFEATRTPVRYSLVGVDDPKCRPEGAAAFERYSRSIGFFLTLEDQRAWLSSSRPRCIVVEQASPLQAQIEYRNRYDNDHWIFGLGYYEFIRYEVLDRTADKVLVSTHDYVYHTGGVAENFYCSNSNAFRKVSSRLTVQPL